MGVVCSPVKAEVASVIAVHLWKIKPVSESGCEALNDMIFRAREREICLEHLGRRVLCGRLRTESHG